MENTTLKTLFLKSRENPELLTLEATVASGLETIAQDECIEAFGKETTVVVERGRIYFNLPTKEVHKVFNMRSIDNVYLIAHVCDINYVSQKDEDLLILKQQYSNINWRKPFSVWKEVYNFVGILYPIKEEYETYLNSYVARNSSNPKKCKGEKRRRESSLDCVTSESESKEPKHKLSNNLDSIGECKDILQDTSKAGSDYWLVDLELKLTDSSTQVSNEEEKDDESDQVMSVTAVPKFRVSAKRVGTHSFSSEDVAKLFGAVIQEDFLWIVDLNNFNMEIMMSTIDSELKVSISLTKFSLHRRNLTAFGLTSLRATICYSLVKLALPEVGDIVVDPLAGSGSIPLEGSLAYPGSYFIAGDSHDNACSICNKNFSNINSSRKKSLPMDLLKWNAMKLPFKTSTIDIIVTDMPFGKRSGSKKSNKVLYPGVLKEFGRVVRKGSGKAVLLTGDRRSLEMAHSITKNMWKLTDRRCINVGGIKAVVFVLLRSMLD